MERRDEPNWVKTCIYCIWKWKVRNQREDQARSGGVSKERHIRLGTGIGDSVGQRGMKKAAQTTTRQRARMG